MWSILGGRYFSGAEGEARRCQPLRRRRLPRGCQFIYTFDGFPPEYISNPAFWQALAQALGVPESSLSVGPTADNWTTTPTVPAVR